MNINNLLDLYMDYLLVTPNYSIAIGLPLAIDNTVSYDQVIRLLLGNIDANALVQEIRCEEGLLIIDDWIEPKKHTKANDLITLDYDHCSGNNYQSLTTIHQKQWKVEEFFSSIKIMPPLQKPQQGQPKQQAHFTASMITFVNLND